MDERTEKAFDFAQDTTKELIALATGVVALSVTFLHDIAAGATLEAKIVMGASWFFYIVSILFGVMTLMALTSVLEPKPTGERGKRMDGMTGRAATIWTGSVVRSSTLQVVLFLSGLLLTVVGGILALAS